MQLPYLTLPFSFSDSAWRWATNIIRPMVDDFQRTAPLDAALITPTPSQLQLWNNSKVYAELQDFFQPIGLTGGDIQFFIYKKTVKPQDLGNPHIDTTGPDRWSGDAEDINFRFNVILYGDEDTEMFWWNKNRHSPDVVSKEFPRPNGVPAKRLQAIGETRQEQYAAIGEPDWRSNSLAKINTEGSFVRTDILHAINWTGRSPRFTLSIRFQQPWSIIEAYRERLRLVPQEGLEPPLFRSGF